MEIVEIKAKYENHDYIKGIFKKLSASFKGIDNQIDTYFKVRRGRLKLREGNIENYLIYYERKETKDIKRSNVILDKVNPNSNLKKILMKISDPLVVVYKRREIYYINNVKFHLDTVNNLGRFVEIEARDEHDLIPQNKLFNQVRHYMKLFDIDQKDFIDASYADLLLQQLKA
ncbi:MAG: class IV adenylate cyclase [archaeon]